MFPVVVVFHRHSDLVEALVGESMLNGECPVARRNDHILRQRVQYEKKRQQGAMDEEFKLNQTVERVVADGRENDGDSGMGLPGAVGNALAEWYDSLGKVDAPRKPQTEQARELMEQELEERRIRRKSGQ